MAITDGAVATLTGLRATITELHVVVGTTLAKAAIGLETAGRLVRDRARANMSSHHYMGRAERETKVSAPVFEPTRIMVSTGIHTGDFAPEGKTFEFNWKSKRGLQPPTDPIAEWAIRRGIANPKNAKQIGFAIARAQAKRGYSFGEIHWLDDAARASAPEIVGVIGAAVRLM